jgi:hypothetical protein
MQLHRRKRKYQTTCWAAAISQSRPSRDPAGLVKVDAHFRLHNLRDETDNLPASLKWTLDALRQAQQGSVGWRQGVYDKCGYFLDDDPRHLSTGAITQVIDRRNKGLTLSLTYSE